VISDVDNHGSGAIEYEEFFKMMTHKLWTGSQGRNLEGGMSSLS
jgi:Ca2+-binding EF-hand superfamily protein